MNKQGMSTAFSWVFSLVTLFGLGVLYITFNQVFVAYLVPTIKTQVNSSVAGIDASTVSEIFGHIDKYMDFFHALPFILFFVVVIFMVLVAVRKEREENF